MRRIFHVMFFLTVFLFYWSTNIENHTEADDAFEYALQVEADSHPWLYHPHHLLYGVLTKKAYHALVGMGYPGRAYPFLVFVSSLSAAAAVFLFYRFCYSRYSMRPVSSLFAAGFLALSYGFWRYACEAEVIQPAAVLVLWSVYLATAPKTNVWFVLYAAGVAASSVLFHVTNIIPVFVAIPLFYLLSRKPRYAMAHTLVAGGLVLSAYAWVYTHRPSLAFSQSMPSFLERLYGSLLSKGLVGFGQCLLSGNFMFGYQGFSQGLVKMFPARMLAEEIYMGRHLSLFQCVAPVITVGMFLVVSIYGLFRAVSSWKHELQHGKAGALMMVGGWQTLAVVLLWFVGYASVVLLLEPGNPEVWVLGLIPFWLLACGLLISPIARANELWIVLLMLLALGVHNYVGGIGLLKKTDSDYNRQKAEWVLENSTKGDLILTAGNPVFVRYLHYYANATVMDLNAANPERVAEAIPVADKVFVLNDVFEYPPSMRVRFPSTAQRVDKYAAELKPRVKQRVASEFGGVWEMEPVRIDE